MFSSKKKTLAFSFALLPILIIFSSFSIASEIKELKDSAILENILLKKLPLDYSKSGNISQSLAQIKRNHKLLSNTLKNNELKNILRFISIRLKELESIEALPATKMRIDRISDLSKEIIEANNYILRFIVSDKDLSIALAKKLINRY
jgi:hypothetical protein